MYGETHRRRFCKAGFAELRRAFRLNGDGPARQNFSDEKVLQVRRSEYGNQLCKDGDSPPLSYEKHCCSAFSIT